MAPKDQSIKIVATNRKARRKYAIEDTYEAGLELKGTEVKSLRQGTCSIGESYARPIGDQLYLLDMHIPPYAQAGYATHDPTRRRKLLMHRREIDKIVASCDRRGYTLVPLKVYFKSGYAKVELALGRSRLAGDKREREREKQHRQEVDKALEARSKRRRFR